MDIKKLYQSGKYDEIIKIGRIDKVSDIDNLLIAAAHFNVGNKIQSEKILKKLAKKSPDNVEVKKLLAKCYFALKKHVDAELTYKSLYGLTGDEEYELSRIICSLARHRQKRIPWEEITRLSIQIENIIYRFIEYLAELYGSQILTKIYASNLDEVSRYQLLTLLLEKRGRFRYLVKILSEKLLVDNAIKGLLPKVTEYQSKLNAQSAINFFDHYLINHELNLQDVNDDALNNVMLAHFKTGDVNKSKVFADLLIDRSQDYRHLNNAALVYKKLKDGQKAQQIYLKALEDHNRPYEVVCNLASLYKEYGFYEKAEPFFKEGLRRNGTNGQLLISYIGMLQLRGDLELCIKMCDMAATLPNLSDRQRKVVTELRLFSLNYYSGINDNELLKAYNPALKKNSSVKRETRSRNLKLALSSGDFKKHSAYQFFEGFFHLSTYDETEVFLISNVDAKDEWTLELQRKFGNNFIDIAGLDADNATKKVKQFKFDVAIDLSGRTAGNRLDIFENRIAKLQLSALGYNFTTGSDAIDYLITHKDFYSENESALLKERLIPLSALHPITPREYEINCRYPISEGNEAYLACCSREIRINSDVMKAWCDIHDELGCIIELNSASFRSPEAVNYFKKKYAPIIGRRDFLRIAFEQPIDKVYERADLTLDCFPHNSGTTLFDSVLCGVPFITLRDRVSVGRLGACIAEKVGHDEWIARSKTEYVDLVKDFIGSKRYLDIDRVDLAKKARCQLSNVEEFSSELNAAIKNILFY